MNRKKAASPAPPKVYRSIREVSAELDVKPHVLRYWETQFPALRPKKNRAGNRIYRPEEIMLLTRIKELLYAQRFTIEGARRTLLEEKKPRASSKTAKSAAVSAAATAAAAAEPTQTATAQRPDTTTAERDRLATELAEAHAERERLRSEVAAFKAAQAEVASNLSAARADLSLADDREKTRVAAMAVLRQELLLLTRELRGESEPGASASVAPPDPGASASVATSEPRVSVRAAEENGASQAPVVEQEEPAFSAGAVPISVGA
ncbi:MAG TPA: MerR family transcriptional regulator [Candidatus Eisenbacteria bacterium]|nr:MerR family transcriptional regulator [Candidatus Eisenbacteria bacterium]